MLDLQHNVVSMLYTIKGMIETHFAKTEENLFKSKEDTLDHAQAVLKRIYSQAEKALIVTRRISRAMKAEQDTHDAQENIALQEIWNEVIGLLEQRYLLDVGEFITHIPSNYPQLRCNRRDLFEILYCLAENAVHAMEGNGKLVIRANLMFKAEDAPLGNIVIADTGPGMPEETLTHLFEPFMTTKSMDKGSGLGLCLVKNLVKKNGGSISVSSFKGCGTTFALTFAVAKPEGHEQKSYAMTG